MALELLGRDEFLRQVLELLVELEEPGTLTEQVKEWLEDPQSVWHEPVWDLGFDSALVVDLFLFVEDLGGQLPDDLPWESITLEEVYAEYATSAVRVDFDRAAR